MSNVGLIEKVLKHYSSAIAHVEIIKENLHGKTCPHAEIKIELSGHDRIRIYPLMDMRHNKLLEKIYIKNIDDGSMEIVAQINMQTFKRSESYLKEDY